MASCVESTYLVRLRYRTKYERPMARKNQGESMPARDSATRPRLSRERVLQGAVAVADAGGIASLTIRSLAAKLGVKPMSVYHHVANKDEILDGIVDLVFAEIELPTIGGDWRRGDATAGRLGP